MMASPELIVMGVDELGRSREGKEMKDQAKMQQSTLEDWVEERLKWASSSLYIDKTEDIALIRYKGAPSLTSGQLSISQSTLIIVSNILLNLVSTQLLKRKSGM